MGPEVGVPSPVVGQIAVVKNVDEFKPKLPRSKNSNFHQYNYGN